MLRNNAANWHSRFFFCPRSNHTQTWYNTVNAERHSKYLLLSKDKEGLQLKEDTVSKEKIRLLEKEIVTLTDKMDRMSKELKEIEEVKNEIRGLKLFLGRTHSEFKSKFPEIMQKVYKKK